MARQTNRAEGIRVMTTHRFNPEVTLEGDGGDYCQDCGFREPATVHDATPTPPSTADGVKWRAVISDDDSLDPEVRVKQIFGDAPPSTETSQDTWSYEEIAGHHCAFSAFGDQIYSGLELRARQIVSDHNAVPVLVAALREVLSTPGFVRGRDTARAALALVGEKGGNR